MPKAAYLHLKPKAVELRRDEHLSLNEIHRLLGVPKATLSGWLRDLPLPTDLKREKIVRGSLKAGGTRRKARETPSGFSQIVSVSPSERRRKMKIAEAAVLFRLAVFDFDVYRAEFDGDRVDWLVGTPKGLKKLQVRWAAPLRGLPEFKVTCADGAWGVRPLDASDFDFIVGYDFESDTAYVFTFDEVRGRRSKMTVREDAAERWDKLRR